MEAGLMTLNKTQCHCFHEVKMKCKRRITMTLPATEGRSGITLDWSLSPWSDASSWYLTFKFPRVATILGKWHLSDGQRGWWKGQAGGWGQPWAGLRKGVSLQWNCPWGGRIPVKCLWMKVLPGNEAKGQVQKVGCCEEKCLQGRRGLFWLQVRWQWGTWGNRAAGDTSPGARVKGPGPARLLFPSLWGMEGERRGGKEGGSGEWGGGSPLLGLVEGREGGEAAPGEGRRRRGREGMLLNSFLP